MKKILVCTDGSSYCQVACQYAAWLAQKTSAEIEALYVTDLRQFEVPFVADLGGSLGAQPYRDITSQLQEVEKQKASVIEEITRRAFTKAGVSKINFNHETGLLVDSLEEYEPHVDCIILGKRGANVNFATEHLGSTMERVLRTAKRPCLVTSRSFHEISNAVIAYDGSPSCRRSLEFITKTGCLNDIALTVVTVAEKDTDHERKRCENLLEEAATSLATTGGKVNTELLEGAAEDEIARYVSENETHMLVIGAYGHNRIRYLLIGSTTTSLIRSCHIPVLCFR